MTTTAARPGPAPTPAPAPTNSPAGKEKPKETFRDFVEQIVVAVILAILIRGFDAEAFVIPTGSMAPTLMGRHKEITCPQCGEVYTVNSSEELEAVLPRQPRGAVREQALCVNCRWAAPVGESPSFKGDRILVMKFPYELPVPARLGRPSALGRRRLPLSRAARAELHQAARRPAGRGAEDPPRRHLHPQARQRRPVRDRPQAARPHARHGDRRERRRPPGQAPGRPPRVAPLEGLGRLVRGEGLDVRLLGRLEGRRGDLAVSPPRPRPRAVARDRAEPAR